MHIGTFTPEGTWRAAEEQLPALADLGVTILELMPVADFAGRFGWGYDGVDFFAPTRLYGRPDDFRRFVNAAHALGLAVILDVVYNHLGPDGNYLAQFGSAGLDPGQFDEPVGIAIDENGILYVADTWNQRVQTFTPAADGLSFTPLKQWDVAGWVGQSLDNKPFIAVDNARHVFVTDPEGFRVIE